LVGDRKSRSVREVEVGIDPDVAHVGFHFGASFLECKKFIDAVTAGAPPAVTVEDGLWSVVIGAAAHRSIDERRSVDISEFGLS
jgi:predicted dehydrogenase